jgi:hypothetical protein
MGLKQGRAKVIPVCANFNLANIFGCKLKLKKVIKKRILSFQLFTQ